MLLILNWRGSSHSSKYNQPLQWIHAAFRRLVFTTQKHRFRDCEVPSTEYQLNVLETLHENAKLVSLNNYTESNVIKNVQLGTTSINSGDIKDK